MSITTRVNGEVRQNNSTERLMFPFDFLIAYLSTFATLKPGDIIATGTPTGAGARSPRRAGSSPATSSRMEIRCGMGTLRNTVAEEQ